MNRYSRHIQLTEIGEEGQRKISQAKVLVVGAGGLSCPVLQYLTAAGIGTLGIIDFDVVEESNLQRQVLFGTSTIGMNKALAAKQRLEDLNPTISIHAYPEKLTTSNAIALFTDYDIIVDGSDTIATRYLINDAAIVCDKPIVYGAIYKFEGHLAVFNYNHGPTYRSLFPDPPRNGSVANCSEVGVLGVLPGIIGAMQANEVLKIVLGFSGVLSGKLLCYHSQTGQTNVISIPKSKSSIEEALLKTGILNDTYEATCDVLIPNISAEEALQTENNLFVDVRAVGEIPEVVLPNSKHIPLHELEQHLDEFRFEKNYMIFCATGARSTIAIARLQKHFNHHFYNVVGGATALLSQIKQPHE